MGQFFCTKQFDNECITKNIEIENEKKYEILELKYTVLKQDINEDLELYRKEYNNIKNQLNSLTQDVINTTFYLNKLKKSKSKIKHTIQMLYEKEQYILLNIKHIVPSNKPYSITFNGRFNTKYNCYCYDTILNPVLDITFSNMNTFTFLKPDNNMSYDNYKLSILVQQGIDKDTQQQPINISISNKESIRLSVNKMKYIGNMDIELNKTNTLFTLYDENGNDITHQLIYHFNNNNTTRVLISWDDY